MRRNPVDTDALLADYQSGMTQLALAEKYRIGTGTVYNLLRAHPGYINRGKAPRSNVFRIIDGHRKCRTCGLSKPVGAFQRQSARGNRLGISAHCKDCGGAARRAYLNAQYATLRAMVIAGYGGCCVRCGFSDQRALHIDHVHDDGAAQRRQHLEGLRLLRRIVSQSFPSTYQVLCANCNTIKAQESGLFGRAQRSEGR